MKITVVDYDDCLGLEVFAASPRFAGSASTITGLHELSALAACIEGFPTSHQDERTFEFGTRDPQFAGGFVRLQFHCVGRSGDSVLEVEIEDEGSRRPPESARFALRIEAAALDRFTRRLRSIEQERSGTADLPSPV